MNHEHRDQLVDRFLTAWNSQNVERVLACYTTDVRYRDPNTRGEVAGRDAMRRYLARLFGAWTMTWAKREVFELAGMDGVAFLWRATFLRSGATGVVEIDGIDLVLLRGDRVARNEVQFDRALLS